MSNTQQHSTSGCQSWSKDTGIGGRLAKYSYVADYLALSFQRYWLLQGCMLDVAVGGSDVVNGCQDPSLPKP
eukprot:1289996-Pleurochrysis_carterae.AAC.3